MSYPSASSVPHDRLLRIKWVLLCGLLLAVLIPWQSAQAADCETTGRGLWSVTSTWDCGIVPDGDDNVTISHPITATTAISVNNVSLTSIGSLSAQGDVIVGGNWTDNGAFQPITGTQVIFDSSTVTQTISGGAGPNSLVFRNVKIANDHTGAGVWVRIDGFIEVSGIVTVTSGAALHLANGDGISYADETNDLINEGTLKVTREIFMGGGSNVQFPTGDAAGYYGVAITTTNTLGSVDVIIEGNAADCTTGALANYVQRCYTIIPENPNNSATVRFFALNTELNGIELANLVPYHHVSGSGWVQLTNVVTGTVGANYSWAEGETTGFSSFLLADSSEAPTVVSLTSLTAAAAPSEEWLAALLLLGMALLLFTWLLRRRRVGSV